ncbi:MAG: hypothetical protein ABFQ65_01125 [Nanoarchaeota archaeon]
MDFKKIKINFLKFYFKNQKKIKFSFTFSLGIFLLIFFTANQFSLTGKIIDTEGYKIIPLNPQERQIIEQNILSSEFIKDIPKKDPIFLRFFSFENGERVWQDGFLVGRDGILTQGEPSIYFSIHSKYISELNGGDLCSIIGKANKKGDVGIYSDYNKARLFLKYAGMLKHRGCLRM